MEIACPMSDEKQNPPSDQQKQVAREAALWLLELRGRLRQGIERTPEERDAAFIVWLLQSAEHVKAYLIASAMCSKLPLTRKATTPPSIDS